MSTGADLTVIVVDDEPPAVDFVCSLLRRESGVRVAATFNDGGSAVGGVIADPPDVVVLDVQMPVLDGIGVAREIVRRLPATQLPAFIFVTAYNEYAVQAFDVHAIDYVLKPVDEDRFARAFARIRAVRAERRDTQARLMLMLDTMLQRGRYSSHLVARDGTRAWFVPIDDVSWIEAARKHVVVHAAGTSHPVREGITEVEARLDPALFVRISRSTIVSIRQVREVQPWFNGEYVLVMRDGTRLTTTRGYRDRLRALLD